MNIACSEIRTTRYWGGIPVGRLGAEFTSTGETDARFQNTLASDVFLYNHWNINIAYRTTPNEKYEIVRFWVEPFSVQHDSNNNNVASCASDSTSHTDYTQLANVPVQSATGFVKFTYDVRWIAMDESNIHYSDRWDIYLDMDDATPDYIEFLGAFLGVFLLCVLAGSLFTWVQRDLSYKPLVESVVQDIEHVSDDGAEFTDEQTKEVQMWPLSTHVFFPPVTSPLALCIACGTGAHLFIAGFWFILLFRCGIINQSQGDKLLTPGAILYSLTSPLAGYVTARLYAILHGDRLVAMTASLVTAIAFPLLGILTLYLVYDVLPDDTKAPAYNVVSNSTPFILLWIFGIWPMTVLGGAVGYSHGPMQNFPVSTGTTGYHDLNLQNNNDEDHNPPNGNKKVLDKFSRYMHRYRCLIFFLTCGILPCLSSFISYSYAVAAPILIGSYSLRAYLVLSYLLFVAVAAATSLLLFYRQLRVHNYQWWWSSYAAGASAGLYTFLLSASWVLTKDANPNDAWRYTLWFAFVSFGVSLVTGFSSTAACVWFNRILYMVIMRRRHG